MGVALLAGGAGTEIALNYDDGNLRLTTVTWTAPEDAAVVVGNNEIVLAAPGGSVSVPGNRRVTLNALGEPEMNFPLRFRSRRL